MKRKVMWVVCFLALPLAAYCAQMSRIELTDGSVINGEIVSFANGVYTVNTSSFGSVTLKASQVYKIQTLDSPVPAGRTSLPQAEGNSLGAYQKQLMSNPQNVAVLTGLASDPQIQALTQDPDIVEAAKSGDIQSLMKNKKFMDLVNDTRLREAMDKLKQ